MDLIKVPGPKSESQRHAGALVIRELAEHAPAVMYHHRKVVLDDIWVGINDLAVRVINRRLKVCWGGGEGGGGLAKRVFDAREIVVEDVSFGFVMMRRNCYRFIRRERSLQDREASRHMMPEKGVRIERILC